MKMCANCRVSVIRSCGSVLRGNEVVVNGIEHGTDVSSDWDQRPLGVKTRVQTRILRGSEV